MLYNKDDMTEAEIKNFSDSDKSQKAGEEFSFKEIELADCFKKIAGPAFLAGLADILIKMDLSSSSRPFSLFLSWSVRFILFAYIGYQAVFKYKEDVKKAAVLGLLAGLAVGLFSAVYKFILARKVWTAFNLIAEPVWLAFLAAFLTAVFSWLFIKFKNKK